MTDLSDSADSPKGGRSRVVPLTDALFEALKNHRHLRGDHVLFGNDGKPATTFFRNLLEAAQKKAGMQSRTGGIHILRHTFCSHLAMWGAPAKAIHEISAIGAKNMLDCVGTSRDSVPRSFGYVPSSAFAAWTNDSLRTRLLRRWRSARTMKPRSMPSMPREFAMPTARSLG